MITTHSPTFVSDYRHNFDSKKFSLSLIILIKTGYKSGAGSLKNNYGFKSQLRAFEFGK